MVMARICCGFLSVILAHSCLGCMAVTNPYLLCMPESTEGFVWTLNPLGTLIVILTLTHLGAGNSGSLVA